jgi:alpha-2-macroglobulin
MKAFRLLSLLVLSMSFLFFSCERQSKKSMPNPDFAAYISDYSHGILPSDAPVNITLAVDTKSPGETGTEVLETLFSFKPAVKGKSYWIDNRTIRFIPEGKWPRDKQIEVSFFLNKLISVPEAFHIFRFNIQTLPLTFEVGSTVLNVNSESEPDLYQLTGSIVFSEAVSPEKLDGLLSFNTESEKKKFTFQAGSNPQIIVFSADSIRRQDKEYNLQLAWEGSVIGSKSSGKIEIAVPAKGEFSVNKIEVQHLPSQAVHIWFSDYLDNRQNLKGLVSLSPDQHLNYSISKNKITAFPTDALTGGFDLQIASGIRNASGNVISDDFIQQISFELLKPEVKFVGNSTILAGEGSRVLPFQAVGLRAVDVQIIKIFEKNMLQFLQWNTLDGSSDLKRVGRIIAREQIILQNENSAANMQWQTYAVDLDKLIGKDEASLYRVMLTFKKEYALWNCGEITNELKKESPGPTEEELKIWGDGYYYDPSYYYPDDFSWYKRDDPCDNSYYYYERFPSRNLLASNIGLIAKQLNPAAKEYNFYVNNLVTTEPLQGVKVELFDYQQQSIVHGSTNAMGMVKLKVGDVAPFVAVASTQKQRAFLKLDEGAALSLGRFDVSGNQIQGGMKGFVFNERGVYRPGDTLFIGFILKSGEMQLPENYPVVLELTNAKQQLVARQTQTKLSNGMCLFKVPTSPDAPTGVWNASIKAGNASFSKRIRVEKIKPNRLKINFDFGRESIANTERNRSVNLKVNWLHGAVAAGMDVSLERTVSASELKFNNLSGFVFSDPSKYFETDKDLQTGKTNDSGLWTFKLNLPDYRSSKGKLRMTWLARVTEPGGDFSIATHTLDFHPFDKYIGLAVPKPGKEGYITTDQTQQFDVISVSPDGKYSGSQSLKVEVFKLDWSWWWSGDNSNRADYVSTYNAQKIYEDEIILSNGKGSFQWTPKHPQWGNFFVRVSDEKGGHSTGQVIYVDWPDWYSRSGRKAEGGASLLSVSTDKESYKTGEKAVISFSSPVKGRALVSLENGSQQLQSWWVETTEKETKISLPLTSLFSPNVYVHITLLQPMKLVENDMPVRSYGVVSLLVEDSKSRLNPVIKMPEETKTGAAFDITVSEQNGKSMSYILAVVDEGLLDLTNFKTPDAHALFYAKEALGIKTWDMYDFVLGAYGGKIEQIFAIGGDESLPDREKMRQSRFVPVVRVFGPVELKSGKTNKHTITIENYIGSVKAMLIAVSENAYGKVEKTMAVKQPLMVLGTLPRVLRQKDELMLPVTVFSSIKGAHSVEVSVKAEGSLTLTEPSKQSISFDKEGEKLVWFKLQAASSSGKGKISISANSAGNDAKHELEIAVQNPNTRVYQNEQIFLKAGESISHTLIFPGEPKTQKAQMEVSSLPAVNLKSRLDYLLQYPYGCIEQIVSQGFAQLYLDKTLKLEAEEKLSLNNSVQSAIRQVTARQRADGSVAYWPGSIYVNEWSDIYAGHFMTLASRENFAVPSMFLNLWAKNQGGKAQKWQPEIHADRILNDLLQAYRLYALALADEQQINAMNRLRENPKLSQQAADVLAAAYAVAGQENAARQLALGNAQRVFLDDNQIMTFGSELRNKAMRLETLLLLNEEALAFPLVKELADELSGNGWLSTQSTAWSLYAWQLFAKKYNESGKASFSWSQGKSEQISLSNTLFTQELNASLSEVTVQNTGDKPIYINWITSGIPAADDFPSFEKGIVLNIRYVDAANKTIDPASLRQGTPLTMIAEVKNTSGKRLEYLALSKLIPAGWEIVNARLHSDIEQSAGNADYSDIRDDRVVHFFDLASGAKRTFKTELIATYEGRFLLPAVRCEAMYDNTFGASTGGSWVNILRK